MTTALAPDERALRLHLQSGRFQAGVSAGHWRLLEPLAWPIAFIAISAAPRENAPEEFTIRFDLQGYPNVAPTGGLWDVAAGDYMGPSGRPKGERASRIFRCDNWDGGGKAMYAAWDRIALHSHPQWAQSYPRTAWHSGRDLTSVLANVHEVLTADDYLGV